MRPLTSGPPCRPIATLSGASISPAEALVDLGQRGVDGGDGGERVARGGAEAVDVLEHRHHAVAHVFVDAAAAGLDRAAGLGEEGVEDIDDVEGELRLAERG